MNVQTFFDGKKGVNPKETNCICFGTIKFIKTS